jgi:hypothetical protein
MKQPLIRVALAVVLGLAVGSVGMIPVAEAAGNRGGGGGGGGGAHAGGAKGGGGAAKQRAPSNAQRDARANNVRSTSVSNVNNNVNVNKNVNVNVDADRRGCCGGWDDDYHPVATAAAVTATVAVTSAVVGAIVNSPPPGCVPVNYGGILYQQCGTVWYQPQGTQYVVINPPY